MKKLAAFALALCLLPSAARAHGWYSGLKGQGGISCCNDRDCRPVDGCTTLDGREGLRLDGQCTAIPWSTVLPVASPDGRYHACWGHYQGRAQVRCTIIPGAS